MSTVISVENLSKSYHLGQIDTPAPAIACGGRTAGTFTHDLKLWWAMVRGKPKPFLIIGGTDYGNSARKQSSDNG